jgi:hypothetical protein
VTLVCVPGTVISRAQLSRIRYEAAPLIASQANVTLHDVLPVTRSVVDGVGGGGGFGAFLLAGSVIDDVPGSVASRQAAAPITSDPARAHESDCRNARIEAP